MIIELLNGVRYDIEDYGLGRLFHHIPSADITHNTTSVSGIGDIITETIIGQRTIPVDIAFKVADIFDFYLLRDELNALFLRKEAFYIIFKREPYKRWLVKINDGFTIPPTPRGGSFTLQFRTVQRYAESIATTTSEKEWDADVWGWNNTITWDEPLTYIFSTNTFNVLNLGTAEVEPENWGLLITVKATAESFLKIRNVTTGEEYQYNDSLTTNDTLLIKNVQSFKNGTSVFKDTNKQVISLVPGVNNIEITGGTVQSIAFDFRFPFK